VMSLPIIDTVTGIVRDRIQVCQKKSLRWFAQRPILTLVFIIICGVVLLPAVTMVVLTPVAFLVNSAGIFTSPGGISTLYDMILKGFLLSVFFVGLVAAGFLIITCVSVMHSYKLFSFWSLRMKQQ